MCAGWKFMGELVVGRSEPCQDGKDYDLGAMWECPFFVKLADASSAQAASPPVWMLCVSPYPHFRKDRPTNPCLYWLGSFEAEQFQLGQCAGQSAFILRTFHSFTPPPSETVCRAPAPGPGRCAVCTHPLLRHRQDFDGSLAPGAAERRAL